MDFLAHHNLERGSLHAASGRPWCSSSFLARWKNAHKIAGNVFGALGFFLVSLPLVRWWNPGEESPFSFEESAEWIPSIGARYHLGIDGNKPLARHAHHVSRE